MVTKAGKADSRLAARLQACTEGDPEYWSFRCNAVRDHSHGLFQYPAMMVPQMQDRLIGEIAAVDPEIRCVYDPFVGSGTVLTEAMLRGLDFRGCDVNPLAVLVSRVKAGPFYAEALRTRWQAITRRAEKDQRRDVDCGYSGWKKWFRLGVAVRLTRLARAIRSEVTLWSRRFFWVVLAETVRLTSNSRTSTFKLHVRPTDEIALRNVDPLDVFGSIAERNLARICRNAELLAAAGRLRSGHYDGDVEVEWRDSANEHPRDLPTRADLLVTSPPYGDNVTTVPYGQHAFLPLQWIDLEDIDPSIDSGLLMNTHAIDTRSLGGSRVSALDEVRGACQRSPSLRKLMKGLQTEPRDRAVRVAAFWRDMDRCLVAILNRLRENAYMVWVVGERRVGNRAVPMHRILAELVQSRGGVRVALLERRIPSKRMAVRNDISQTMRRERVLIMRKGAS